VTAIKTSSLWFDQTDAQDELNRRLDSGVINENQFQMLNRFIRDGYVVLPEKIPAEVIDAINQNFNDAHRNRDRILLRKGGEYTHPGPLGIVGRRKRVIDFYVPCRPALTAILAQPITDFLRLLYGEAPLAFQALLFQFGSQQAMHQDPAYVVTDNAAALTASWIALEDIKAGSGELTYYKGSHRGIDVTFEGGKKVWIRHVDDKEDNLNYMDTLVQTCESRHLEKQTFLAKKGEVLIWHSGLVHGGSEINNKDLTRRSLVTHYCPASGRPNYFNIPGQVASKRAFSDGFYSSRHYDVRPESQNPYPIYTGGKDIRLDLDINDEIE
jgi:phytanoyl-CoA hydroxylase